MLRVGLLFLAALCTVAPAFGQAFVSKTVDSGPRDGKSNSELTSLAEGFGIGVAIDGKTAFVGESQGTLTEGLVVVFVRADTSGTWVPVDTLFASPPEPGNRFGEVIAVDGDWLFVGAPAANDQKGVVYVFEQQSLGVWTQHQVLSASTPVAAAGFASGGMAVSGDRAIVGAAPDDAAYVYTRNGVSNMWSEEAKLVGNSPLLTRRFGWSVDVDGDRAIVGAIREFSFQGGAYIFDRDGGGAWNQSDLVNLSDGVTYDYFGADVELKGDIALVSTLGYGSRAPFVTSFLRDSGGNWNEKNRVSGVGSTMFADSAALATSVPYADSVHVLLFDSTFSVQDGFKSSTASAGEEVGYRLGLSGDYLVAGAPGNFAGKGHAYFFERAPDSTWSEVAAFEGPGATFPSITGGTIPCSAGFASIFPCQGIDLASFVSTADLLGSGHVSDIWGWRDDSTGQEYAIVTQADGTNFVDVTDPENPLLVGLLPIHAGSSANSWHDVRVYKDHAFIVADAAGQAGVQVFDLKQLASAGGSPVAALSKGSFPGPIVFTETAYYGGVASTHNISINEATGFAYVVGANGAGTTCGGGLHMLDVSTPTTPVFEGCFADATTGRYGTGYSHDVQCVVYHGPDAEHQGKEVCFSSNETHVVIVDVTDKDLPTTIAKGTYPEAQYIHQGWLTEDHRYFLQDDELDEAYASVTGTKTYIWDIQDLDDPILVATYSNPAGFIDHNQFVLGRYSLQADYTAGIRVVDFGDPLNPVEVMYFDTFPSTNGTIFDGAWGNYPYLPSGLILATSIQEGFFVLKPTVPLRLALDLRVFLEGPYASSDSMSTGALFEASVPSTQPYLAPEYNGTALDFDLPEMAISLPENAVDWVLVELRESATDTAAVTAETGILLRNGRVVAASGDTLRFDGALPGAYWIIIRHRNHLAVMSSGPVDLASGTGAWDFTDSSTKAYGSNAMKLLADGRFGMFASDGSIDNQITAPDFNLWNAATTAGLTGYRIADFNLDGQVTAPDFNLWNSNTTAGATSKVP